MLKKYREVGEKCAARLPGGAATERLASLIATLPDGLPVPLDPSAIAARLVKLLPRPAIANIPSRKTMHGIGAVTKLPPAKYMIPIVVALVVAALWIVTRI